jgi:hypothetical protein
MTNSEPLAATMGGGSRPVPDPTVLTTEALTRQIANLKELVETKIDGETEVNKQKFRSIDAQFTAIEAWRQEQKIDTKTAVDAALSAAEKGRRDAAEASDKAIAKSETAAKEQMNQQTQTFGERTKSMEGTISDLKDRVLRIEAMTVGITQNRAETRVQRQDSQSLIFALIGVAISVIIVGVTIAVALTAR